MSFMEYPQPDACRALMPTPEPSPPGPPSRPMVCHMPKGHYGPHAVTRRPGPIDRRWEGDARPERPAVFDASPTPPECDPGRVETVARAMWNTLPATATGWHGADPASRQTWLRLAAAAIAADPSPAEEAVKRVEALADEWLRKSSDSLWHHDVLLEHADDLRAALASPAPAPQEPACQWAHGPVTDLDSRGLCPVCAEDEL